MERTDFEHWEAREVARLLALVETEKRYFQQIIAAIPMGLAVLAADRSIVSTNRAFRKMFNLRAEDLRRRPIDQIIASPHLIEKIRDIHVEGSAPARFGIEAGERRMQVVLIPMRVPDNESDAETLLVVEDASPMVSAGQSMPSEGIPAVIWQADAATFAFKSVSGSAEMFGHPAAHWLKTRQFFRDRIHPDDRSATMALYEAAVDRGGDASAEFRTTGPSGNVIWCRETVRASGKTISGVLTDITARKQLEQQVLTAQRSDALQKIASRLAHDLNNPLMVITGYGEEMLHSMGADDPARADAEQILSATERITSVTGQLLGYARKIAKAPVPVNVAALIAPLQEKAGGEPKPLWALADAGQFAEAIAAIVSASGPGKPPLISAGMETVSEQFAPTTLTPGMYTVITIRDESAADPNVFESVMAKDAVSAAIARAYLNVREWGGDIALSSDPLKGSTFTIYLPHFDPAKAAVEVSARPRAVKAVEAARKTILLVDDEAEIRALVRKILRREGYGVLEAGSAEEAMNVVEAYKGKIDLLITDVMLPGKGGQELANGLYESLPRLAVLYISGFTSDEEVRAGASPPGANFLQKPFTLGSLVGKVREALGRS